MFEPDYTEEELRAIDEHARRDREQGGTSRPTISEDWWCLCGCCEQMPREEECLCCKEWELWVQEGADPDEPEENWDSDGGLQRCISNCEDFPHVTHRRPSFASPKST